MSAFEQELVRAMQHGCPSCGRHMFQVVENVAVSKSHPGGEVGLHRGRCTEVRCGEEKCRFVLWDMHNGWMQKMKRIVGGEP